ncbi:hypothetical protein O3P69_002929 [Scylla paramamosain]|uniref:Uncharacterized protein n=1 Tax=Scylla paramamosain TaxID=85552 RepID=A0AAW0UNX6_SCYPA
MSLGLEQSRTRERREEGKEVVVLVNGASTPLSPGREISFASLISKASKAPPPSHPLSSNATPASPQQHRHPRLLYSRC